MNKQPLGKVRANAQAGFTLIELIVVIVILGILAATALPKFADLGGDARAATVNAAKGSLNSVSSMVHGKFLISGSGNVNMEGTSVGITNGYPTANAALMEAAGLKAEDYTVTSTTSANTPTINTGEIVAIPKSIAGTTVGATCYVKYAEATISAPVAPATVGTTNPPLITASTSC